MPRKKNKDSKRDWSRCYECKKLTPYEQINAGMVTKKMKIGELIRSVCDECVKKHNYYSI